MVRGGEMKWVGCLIIMSLTPQLEAFLSHFLGSERRLQLQLSGGFWERSLDELTAWQKKKKGANGGGAPNKSSKNPPTRKGVTGSNNNTTRNSSGGGLKSTPKKIPRKAKLRTKERENNQEE